MADLMVKLAALRRGQQQAAELVAEKARELT